MNKYLEIRTTVSGGFGAQYAHGKREWRVIERTDEEQAAIVYPPNITVSKVSDTTPVTPTWADYNDELEGNASVPYNVPKEEQ